MNKHYLIAFLVIFTAAAVWVLVTDKPSAQQPVECQSTATETENFDRAMALLDGMQSPAEITQWDTAGTMPDDECIKLRLDYPGGTLRQLFNDSNSMHISAAQKIGISPIETDSAARHINRPLVRISSDRYIFVDSLTHSYPYLIPQAAELLEDIGRAFADTLAARGGGNYRLKVTSVLRTAGTVSRLRRVNRASVEQSAHLYGTTFDISYKNFPYHGGSPHRTQEDLKNLLAEILYKLRQDGRCYIKYEHKSGCFHITAIR